MLSVDRVEQYILGAAVLACMALLGLLNSLVGWFVLDSLTLLLAVSLGVCYSGRVTRNLAERYVAWQKGQSS